MNGSTLNVGDVLGLPAWQFQASDPISVGGPNQGFVAPAYSGPSTGGGGGTAPAFSLLGLVLLLVGWRIVVELGGEG